MKKFILIDQSIKDSQGHHLEYALRVLRAAKEQGYYTVLGVNKKSEDIKSEYIDAVEKRFTYTFWENFSETRISDKLKTPILFPKKLVNKLIQRFMVWAVSTPLATAYLVAYDQPFMRGLGVMSHRKWGINSSVFIITLGYAIRRAIDFLQVIRSSRHTIREFSFKHPRRWVWFLFNLILSPIYLIILFFFTLFKFSLIGFSVFLKILKLCLTIIGAKFQVGKYEKQFGADVSRFVKRVNASEGDIVFVPTLGVVETVGVVFEMPKLKKMGLSWHFLFRRNIFNGREPQYNDQIASNIETANALELSKYAIRVHGAHIYFYTDTDALTIQYNKISGVKFTTLPIPSENTAAKIEKDKTAVLNISYIGDARDEKGYHKLPKLVGDLRATQLTEDKIHFHLQSNFNVKGGETNSALAKAMLRGENRDYVSLPEGPFDSETYDELIHQTDIMLIPYSGENYYARSSGVFSESLAAGIPFVATDKTWMSQEALSLNQAYYESLKIHENPSYKPIKLLLNEERRLNGYGAQEHIWLLFEIDQDRPLPGHYLNIGWQRPKSRHKALKTVFSAGQRLLFFNETAIDLRLPKAYGLACIPNISGITISAYIDGLAATHKTNLQIKVSILDMPFETPLFIGGAFYTDENDFSHAVYEVIRKYDHYKRSAADLQKQWNSFHNMNVFLEKMK